MLRFKHFLLERKETEYTGKAGDDNGVRHELIMAGVLNHMSKHHANPSEHPNLFNMNDKELREHFDSKVRNGGFNEHLPEHFRDEFGNTPAVAHAKRTENISENDHFTHFKNAVEHAKRLHEHLSERGYDPTTVGNVHWTSKEGDVNNFMKKPIHSGTNSNRETNKITDDGDLMFTVKRKGESPKEAPHPVNYSLKWASAKSSKPTLKNNTHNTYFDDKVFTSSNDGGIKKHTPEMDKIISEFKSKTDAENARHENLVNSHYATSNKGISEDKAKRKFVEDENNYNTDENARNRVDSIRNSYETRSNNTGKHLSDALTKINNLPNGTESISNLIRNKAQTENPDFVSVRSRMSIDKNNKQANSHHFEDHSNSMDEHLKNVHSYQIVHSGATVNIHGHDKDGNRIFTYSPNSKHNSRASDKTNKILSKISYIRE